MKLLIDSGAAKNYIKIVDGIDPFPVENKFKVNSIHGSNIITTKYLFNVFGGKHTFFVLPQLEAFDGIIGLDTLILSEAVLDLKDKIISTVSGEEHLSLFECNDVNMAVSHKLNGCESRLEEILASNQDVFADPNESLSFNTNVVASIRTVDNDPIYAHFYAYPVGVSDFVNKEIQDLLDNGIIRKSRSPYNSPIWIVDKKGTDEFGAKKRRMVIDFRKLNEKTIDDKYPVPDINNILSNLGRGKLFSKVDLKSGFHQIVLRESDREKTAFSVNNGKYEFCRLPFGLKNAPRIFQRALDDILREAIGRFVFVYMDDIIIFSESAELHLQHIEWVLDVLYKANMRVSREKSEFLLREVEYLGFIVSKDGVKTCPDKVAAILNFPAPITLFDVRSFIGLAGYYRRFIRDFASIAKPLTELLKGENGLISANKSKGVAISLSSEQLDSFNRLRRILASEDVILQYPDFKQAFDVTTDASGHAIGAVLSQGDKPIMMISRTLKGPELGFATNERELLAIIWALKKFRSYLYGINKINIYTDHQPLAFSVSDKNTNAKIKRWKAFIDEHNAKVFYKPGKANVVADALSRQFVNIIEDDDTMAATVHSEESSSHIITKTDSPLNGYGNQIVVEESNENSIKTFIVFRKKKRHVVRFTTIDNLINQLRSVICRDTVNAIHCELSVLGKIQNELVNIFPTTRLRFAPKFVSDITNREEQKEIVTTEHNRAHRCVQNVVEAVLRDYYFPRMTKVTKEIVSNCSICKGNKYVRHPVRQLIAATPIPSKPGERLHIDIYSTDSKHFLTCIDKFSKFAVVQEIKSRSIVDITPALLQLFNIFSNVKYIYCDNEASLNSQFIASLVSRYGATISSCPPDHSQSNGQVERFHSTLAEMARCLKEERSIDDVVELLYTTAIEYNRTVHSRILERPIDVLYLPALEKVVKERLKNAQERDLARFNKKRQHRLYNLGDVVYVKVSKRRGTKLTLRFVKRKIQADLGSTVLIRGRVVHKDSLR